MKTLATHLLELAQSHWQLGLLETRYEAGVTARRVALFVGAGLAALTAFAILQVALLRGLTALGLDIGWAALILTGVYGLVAGSLVWLGTRRDRRAGRPFQGSRDEWARSAAWIRRRFS